MRYRTLVLSCCMLSVVAVDARAQLGDLPIATFGYFQTSFQYRSGAVEYYRNGAVEDTTISFNSFSVQQLNLFFQTDVAPRWRAFVDFELVNNFSSSRRWGSFNLAEAWLRFRAGRYASLKAGLQIPIFNHLNEIKNRTPLLPYVIRPLVYETSFGEFIDLESFVPARAFLQAYGYLPLGRGEVKLDYAAYLGNSPNINSQYDNERKGASFQTGIDTTTTLLVGGRLGLRFRDVKLGVSATRDETEEFQAAARYFDVPPSRFRGIARSRLGADVGFHVGRFSAEAEGIRLTYGEDLPGLSIDRRFVYVTLGYNVTEPLFVFAGFWRTTEQEIDIHPTAPDAFLNLETRVDVPNVGFAYTLLDRITFKAHYAPVDVKTTCAAPDETFPCPVRVVDKELIHFFATAVSVLF